MTELFSTRHCTFQLLTEAPVGHTLNRRQVLSPDAQWVAFDGRNDDTQIGRTRSVGRVHWPTKRVEILYETDPASDDGPGVGAVAFHPHTDHVLFIHGLTNFSPQQPYGMARRFGAIIDCQSPNRWTHAESRCISTVPCPIGALSGGTHAHSWSPSGNRISFTYNDAIQPQLPRTVGFLTRLDPNPLASTFFANALGQSTADSHENFLGRYAAFLLLQPGQSTQCETDELDPSRAILQAIEECWIHDNRIAFLGTLSTNREDYPTIQEVFLAELPSDEELTRFLLSNTPNQFPAIRIERITHTEHWVYPGMQGPRNWLIASIDGKTIYSLAKDANGIVQVIGVSIEHPQTPLSNVEWLTDLDRSVENQIAMDRTGRYLSFVSDHHVHVIDLQKRVITRWQETAWLDSHGSTTRNSFQPLEGESTAALLPSPSPSPYVGGVHFVNANRLIVNRYIPSPSGWWLQIGMLHAIDS